MGVPAGRAGRVALGLRCLLSAAGLGLWWWGVRHWPRPPLYAYGPGFQAWALSFVVLLAAWARWPKWHRPRLDGWSWCVLGLFGVAAALRFYRVTTAPYALHFDEVNDFFALEAMRHGVAENIFSRVDVLPPYPGLVGGFDWLFGWFTPSWFVAQRYAAAALGSLSILTTYLLARRISSRAAAFVASFALTFSYWHLVCSRFQSFFPSTPFAAALMWWLVLRAADGAMIDALLAGVVIGLGLMLYDPIKIMLVALPCWWLGHALVNRGFARRTGPRMLVAGAVAAMALTPLLQRHGWFGYFYRAEQVTVLGASFRNGLLAGRSELAGIAAGQLARLAQVVTGGAELAANLHSTTPLLNWAELLLAGLGLLVCLRRWRCWKATIAPIWLLLTVAAVSLSSVPEASYRLVVALPALAILIGIGAVTTFDRVRNRFRSRWVTFLLALVGLGLAAYDVDVNASWTLRYLASMNHAPEVQILGRAIAQGPEDTRYYMVATPGQTMHVNFRALTQTRRVVTVANLLDEVPRLVDPHWPAVIAVPSWAGSYGLPYLHHLYPDATTTRVSDPSGHLGGYLVRLPAGAVPRPRPTCGLRRTACDGHIIRVDPYVAFLDLQHLCLRQRTPRIEWRGDIDIPAAPLELGITQSYTITSLLFDDHLVLTSQQGGESVAPLCLRPGTHSVAVVSDVVEGAPTTLQLWWRAPQTAAEVVPCRALTPEVGVPQAGE